MTKAHVWVFLIFFRHFLSVYVKYQNMRGLNYARPGQRVVIEVYAGGLRCAYFQWYKGEEILLDQTNHALVIPDFR